MREFNSFRAPHTFNVLNQCGFRNTFPPVNQLTGTAATYQLSIYVPALNKFDTARSLTQSELLQGRSRIVIRIQTNKYFQGQLTKGQRIHLNRDKLCIVNWEFMQLIHKGVSHITPRIVWGRDRRTEIQVESQEERRVEKRGALFLAAEGLKRPVVHLQEASRTT